MLNIYIRWLQQQGKHHSRLYNKFIKFNLYLIIPIIGLAFIFNIANEERSPAIFHQLHSATALIIVAICLFSFHHFNKGYKLSPHKNSMRDREDKEEHRKHLAYSIFGGIAVGIFIYGLEIYFPR